MAKRKVYRVIGVIIAAGLMLVLPGVGGQCRNSASRIEREHGLVLPPSASQRAEQALRSAPVRC